jgi:hypothetical protein
MGTGFEDKWEHTESDKPLAVRLTDGSNFIDNPIPVDIETPTIEQVTAATHNDLNIGVAGKDTAGKVQPLQTDTSGRLIASPPASVGSGNKTVTTAGTQVQLASTTPCRKVNITAKLANTGVIWVGDLNVAAGSGKPLVPLQDIEIEVDDLADIWIDASADNQGVTFLYTV